MSEQALETDINLAVRPHIDHDNSAKPFAILGLRCMISAALGTKPSDFLKLSSAGRISGSSDKGSGLMRGMRAPIEVFTRKKVRR